MNAPASPRHDLPRWAEVLRQKYLAGEASTFVLYRNVFDNVLVGDKLHNLGAFLVEELFKDTKQHVCEVSLERGIRVLSGTNEDKQRALLRQVEEGTEPDLLASLHALEQRMRAQPSTAVIVPYADALLPAGDPSFMAQTDRQTYLVFHRWSLDQTLTQGDNIVVLITESLNAINPGLLSNPKVAAIEIPMPDLPLRKKVIGFFAPKLTAHQIDLFSERTSGLRTVQLANILAGSKGHGLSEAERRELIGKLLEGTPDATARADTLATITAGMTPAEITRLIEPGKTLPTGDADQEVLKVIHARKREMIEKECAGLIEFIEPKHGLSAVGGHEHIKHELMAIAQNLKAGETTLTPMGLLAVGPMGSGKTFVIKAFLKEAGLSAVALKNFRSKWVGSTEANLERVLATVKAMGPIAVIIDEGDRSFGSGGGEDSDGGTSSRVIARLKEFMAEPENRGQVLFVMMTNRPDKLDTDIKRPGRLDRKIPFFYCDTAAERVQVLQAVLSRYEEPCVASMEELLTLCDTLTGYSNADLEALSLLAVELARNQKTPLNADALNQAAADFMPPQERDMIEFMELLAVSETSRRSMLPKRYRDMAIADIQSNLIAAKRRALTR
ncbi:MAG: AAA family ATPase [Gammaproteobacteria bacterium]|jgi:SpoVK/Ycf46/Vps4 family AAA+-type ATPase|uniref:ATP-binding protein n=1 Tax=Hydrogenophaga sp. TaxID=1904254 RepID=UPI0025BCFE3D|nr:AAA family ATPase [Hydrogenophaga sp.]MBU4181597.1 AAA family ATPase [Gammaproteobacteria bacterium]MBU4280948.1 AAA family ATPase [Gammaproteobacteria bacterium]MBU4324037.1 AAA family ATPase [Gammaproteobacteria bacterium]MBU4507114.1 AAA family ATPase [Gammaproteobacteria bacterium]MCG2656744.1 AAA family ATPase [Hydrogenophaga sp.]